MKIQGPCTLNLAPEERIFWIKQFKNMKASSALESRIISRTLARLLGKRAKIALYPDKECPICERSFNYKIYDRHHFVCKQNKKATQFKVDPEILERLRYE